MASNNINEDEQFNQAFGQHTGISNLCIDIIRQIKNNQPTNYSFDNKLLMKPFDAERFTNQAWTLLGRYIGNNTHLVKFDLDDCGLTDEIMTLLFGEIAGSISLKILNATDNSFGIDGLRSMIPFLQNSPYLSTLYFGRNNNFNSECFELVVQASHAKVEKLYFYYCNTTNISALDRYNLPNLECLSLSGNNIGIGRDGCITISNLLQQEGSNLKTLFLRDTGLGDQEAEIIAKSLQENTKLETLHVTNRTAGKGLGVFLKLLVDVSSIGKTYKSNHTLMKVYTNSVEIQSLVDKACLMNKNNNHSHAAGRAKITEYQLNSQNRKKFCRLQGVDYSPGNIFADIEPSLLPKILSLIGARHGQSELYTALIPTAPDLLSYVDRKAKLNELLTGYTAKASTITAQITDLTQQLACLTAQKADIYKRLELVGLEDTKQDERDKGVRSNKRQRI